MKYLLITGSYRSGTTYLYKALNNNKKIKLLYQPTIKLFKLLEEELRKKFKKKDFKNFPLGISKINSDIKIEKIFLKKSKIRNILKKSIQKKNKNISYFKRFNKNLNTYEKFINIKEFIHLIFLSLNNKSDKKKYILGIKEPFIGSLLKILIKKKDLLIINLIRDPREIFYSRNYSKIKNHNDFKNKKHPVILTSLICQRNMETDQSFKKEKRYLSINFQNLISNSELIEKKISFFLNTKISLDKKQVQKKSNWTINSSGEKGNYGSNWKNKISESELAIIEKICGNNLNKYNFIKIKKNDKKFKSLIENFKENKIKILKWTQKQIFLRYNQKLLNTL